MSLRALPARTWRLSALLAILFMLTAAPAITRAEFLVEPEQPKSFNGSFKEVSLRSGAAFSSGTEGAAWTIDGGFRNSFPFYLADNRLSYRYSRGHAGGDLLQIHGLHAAFAIHPFYLALLSKGLLSHFLASLHLELGTGVQFGLLRADNQDERSLGLVGSLGAGFDLPITEANQGGGLWLNALYRRTWTTLKVGEDGEGGPLHDHGLFLGLAWRINGTLW